MVLEERRSLVKELLKEEIIRINRLENFTVKLYILMLIIFLIVILIFFKSLNII